MRLAFAHDHTFSVVPGSPEIYTTEEKLPYVIWQRYLSTFDQLVVIGRSQPVNDATSMSLSSGEHVEFRFLPSLSSVAGVLRRRHVGRAIDKELAGSDALVARLPSEIGALAIQRAETLGLPYMVELVGCPWDALRSVGKPLGKIYAPLAWLRTRRLVWRAPVVAYVTEQFLQQRYPTNGYQVVCSNVEIGPPEAGLLERRMRRISADRAHVYIGTIGSPDQYYKGIDVALEAVRQLLPTFPRIRYRILGKVNEAAWVRRLRQMGLEGHVELHHTRATGRAVWDWLDDIDLYVQPSRTEGLPRALIEAMSRGCPCVGSQVGGIPELLSSDCTHRSGNARDLANTMERLLTDSGRQQAEASRNLRHSARFEAKALMAQRAKALNLLKELAAHRPIATDTLLPLHQQ